MPLLICLIVAVAAFAAGFFLATLRTQREAISAKAQLKAEQQHADENMRRQAQALRAECAHKAMHYANNTCTRSNHCSNLWGTT